MLAVASLLALTLAAGQGGELQIVNSRGTYGYLGAARPKGAGVLPGDVAFFAFDIKGLKLDDAGRASYAVTIEILDPKGQVYYKEGPRNSVAQNFLGGDTLPCAAHVNVPPDTPPGVYPIHVTIADRATKKEVKFEARGKVLPRGFGLIRVSTTADREGKVPVPPVGVIGTSVYVNFATIGFARDKNTKQPSLRVSMHILDDKGKPTFGKPLEGKVNRDIPSDLEIIPMEFGVTLNRVGTFTVELTATCELCGQTSRVSFPLKVVSN